MGLLAATEHQSDLTAGTQTGNFDRDQLTVGNLAEAQRRGSTATPMPISTARLMPSRLGNATWMLIGVSALVGAKHALPRRRGIVVRDDCLLPDFFDCRAASSRQWMAGVRQHDQLVAAKRDGLQAAVRRLKRQDAKVQAPVQDLRGNGRDRTRRTSISA